MKTYQGGWVSALYEAATAAPVTQATSAKASQQNLWKNLFHFHRKAKAA